MILDHLHDDEVGALDIRPAQHLWIDRNAYRIGARAEPRAALVLDHVELGERVELLVREVHQLPGRHRPLPAAIDRGRVRRIERRQRHVGIDVADADRLRAHRVGPPRRVAVDRGAIGVGDAAPSHEAADVVFIEEEDRGALHAKARLQRVESRGVDGVEGGSAAERVSHPRNCDQAVDVHRCIDSSLC